MQYSIIYNYVTKSNKLSNDVFKEKLILKYNLKKFKYVNWFWCLSIYHDYLF